MQIDKFSRYQKHLNMAEMFPNPDGNCACGCGIKLTGRRTRWAHNDHSKKCLIQYSIIKGDTSVIRNQLYCIDQGACRNCGELTDNWEADHIIPVCKGGGGCDMDNFQTLCKPCHKEKTKIDLY